MLLLLLLRQRVILCERPHRENLQESGISERDVLSFCRDKRLANIDRALTLMVQAVYIGRYVVLITCWYEMCGSRVEQHLRGKLKSLIYKPPSRRENKYES